MTLNKKSNWGGVSYESPSVKMLDIVSEGVLCGSYGDANEAGTELSEAGYWEF